MAQADPGGIGTLALAFSARVDDPGERFFGSPRLEARASAERRGPEVKPVAAWRHCGRSATPWPNEPRGILCKSGEWWTRNMRG
jgi:hypothetical protein